MPPTFESQPKPTPNASNLPMLIICNWSMASFLKRFDNPENWILCYIRTCLFINKTWLLY